MTRQAKEVASKLRGLPKARDDKEIIITTVRGPRWWFKRMAHLAVEADISKNGAILACGFLGLEQAKKRSPDFLKDLAEYVRPGAHINPGRPRKE